MRTFPLLALLLSSATAHAATCAATLANGRVVRAPLAIERERGGPIGYGEAELAGLKVRFESGFGGVDEDASAKYVFKTFSIYRGPRLLLTENVGEAGLGLDRDLADPVVRHLRCEL